MATNDNEQFDSEFMALDLKEKDGGPQLILSHKRINENEHCFITVGNGPMTDNQNEKNKKKSNNSKFRFFKLVKREGQKYLLQEAVTPEGICEVAQILDSSIGKEDK